MNNWLRQALTGADNQTIAIGRLIGFAIAVVLLIGLPITAAAAIALAPDAREGHDRATTWAVLFQALEIFVPAMAVAIGGLIYGTHTTEPQPTATTNT